MTTSRLERDEDGEPILPGHGELPIVGIGASTGGVAALQAFLPAITVPSNLAYVVVQHLDPDHESVLSKLLARATNLPVVEIAHNMRVEADHVYVIPPNTTLTINGDQLHLSPPLESRGLRTPIDT